MDSKIMSAASDVAGQISGAATNAVSSITGANAKIKDLERDTTDVANSKQTMTADYGASMSNTDAWLKIVDPTNPNGHGPQLLEDQFGREKIHRFDHERMFVPTPKFDYRMYYLTVILALNVWFMPVEQVRMDTSSF